MVVNGVNYDPHEVESAIDEANSAGLTRSFNCCFSSFPPGGDTEEIIVVYLPTYVPEDMIARVQTTDSMSKVVMMSTGCRPKLLPLDRSLLQKSALGKLSRATIKTAYEKGEYQLRDKLAPSPNYDPDDTPTVALTSILDKFPNLLASLPSVGVRSSSHARVGGLHR